MLFKKISFVVFCYLLIFRLYIVFALGLALLNLINGDGMVESTAAGYHLTIFQLEFYFLLIVLYGLRPSRFTKIIMKGYHSDGAKHFSRTTFFWTVYAGLLLFVCGIPLLLFKKTLFGLLETALDSNQYILEHTGLLMISAIFLLLSTLQLYVDLNRSLTNAKVQFVTGIRGLMAVVFICIPIYLLSQIIEVAIDPLLLACLVFNVVLFYRGFKQCPFHRNLLKTS